MEAKEGTREPVHGCTRHVPAMSALNRFIEAQDAARSGFDVALSELCAGRKRGHWIWYVFPQLRGLGSSPMADFYGIEDLAEADAYLRDPILRGRLLAASAAALDQVHAGTRLIALMGSDIDLLKLVSSMTLFGAMARRINEGEAADECRRIAAAAEEILDAAAREGHARCAFTERRLAAEGFRS